MSYTTVHADAFDWLTKRRANSIHAVVTDPPYGLLEYTPQELFRRGNGKGMWRLPRADDGRTRRPTPRFTVLSEYDRELIRAFFLLLSGRLMRVLVPGAHVFVATNPIVSQYVYEPFMRAGFEKRGELIRVVNTLRGGDRPKNAHIEFPEVTVMPKSCWEPWGIFRKPSIGRVQDNLRKYGTGGLKRGEDGRAFRDLIYSSPTSARERAIAPHPSLKPQQFLRQVVRAALPLGKGTVLDPFMGSGSTIAAAEALGLDAVGIEANATYFALAEHAIPKLATVRVPLARVHGRDSVIRSTPGTRRRPEGRTETSK